MKIINIERINRAWVDKELSPDLETDIIAHVQLVADAQLEFCEQQCKEIMRRYLEEHKKEVGEIFGEIEEQQENIYHHSQTRSVAGYVVSKEWWQTFKQKWGITSIPPKGQGPYSTKYL